jgi:ComEC/Rec2-related protein
MSFWIFGYLFGVAIGRYGLLSLSPVSQGIFGMIIYLFVCLKLKKIEILATGLLFGGCFWGIAHSGKLNFPKKSSDTTAFMKFSRSNFLPSMNAKNIFEDEGLISYEVSGVVGTKANDKVEVVSSRKNPMPIIRTQLLLPYRSLRPTAWQNYTSEKGKNLSLADSQINVWRFVVAILSGDRGHLLITTKEDFKYLGIYHLLVISGLHIAMLALVLEWLVEVPFRLLYSVRWICPVQWVRVHPFLRILSPLCLIIFSYQCGFSASIQRACLIYMVVCFLKYSEKIPLKDKLIIAFGLQTILFPIGLVSVGSMLSWGAYLIVANQYMCSETGLSSLFKMQLWLYCYSVFLVGFITPFSIIVNLVVTPLFPPVFLSSFILVVFDSFYLQHFIFGFLEIVQNIAKYLRLYGELPQMPVGALIGIRFVFGLISLVGMLNCLRNLSIGEVRS